jgi:hypothetical protein
MDREVFLMTQRTRTLSAAASALIDVLQSSLEHLGEEAALLHPLVRLEAVQG